MSFILSVFYMMWGYSIEYVKEINDHELSN